MINLTTVSDYNYLTKGISLYESLLNSSNDFTLHYLCIDDKSYDNIWKSEVKKWKIKWGGKRIVQPRFKRDHKQQRRVQSAINYKKINIFLEYAKK